MDGFIATITASEALQPWTGAQIASRLTAAGRPADALAALKRSAPPAFADLARSQARVVASAPSLKAWEDAYLDALEADGQTEAAQAVRWTAFEQRLSADRLRAYLKRLPDFDDVVAEDRALAFVAGFKSFPPPCASSWPGRRSARPRPWCSPAATRSTATTTTDWKPRPWPSKDAIPWRRACSTAP
uniref:Uncharacterized protein n=1 Tax=Phenylobacterium glaciei TaxID=2803784 RepID=A0A974P6T3_9CAUL|nr:hypothetical protein JKL49_13445 [Phenylobacterium glaciei]